MNMKANDLVAPLKMGAGCLILAKDSENFLLIKRSEYVPVASTWSLPGGNVDPEESPIQAARRETMEEIGFDLSNKTMKLIYANNIYFPRFKFFTYACVVPKEFTPNLNWESDSYKWCDIGSLPQPLHWGIQQLFNYDKAAKRLKKFFDQQKSR